MGSEKLWQVCALLFACGFVACTTLPFGTPHAKATDSVDNIVVPEITLSEALCERIKYGMTYDQVINVMAVAPTRSWGGTTIFVPPYPDWGITMVTYMAWADKDGNEIAVAYCEERGVFEKYFNRAGVNYEVGEL